MPARPAGGRILTAPGAALPFLPEEEEACAAPESATVPALPLTLEFVLPEGGAARLLRAPALAALRTGRVRTAQQNIVWHDTPEGALEAAGLAFGVEAGTWRLELLAPGVEDFHPASPPAILAEAADPALLRPALPIAEDAGLAPRAAFSGKRRTLALDDGMTLVLLDGELRGVTSDRLVSRARLTGPAAPVAGLAEKLARQAPLGVPRASLAAEASALASGRTPPPRRLGAPAIPPGRSREAGMVQVLGHLADVMLHWSAGLHHTAPPTGVHQMRVAVRRARSALAVFRPILGETDASIAARLKDLAARLGAARDWDVFLEGTGAAVAAAFPGDRRVEALVASAGRHRLAAYGLLEDFLAGAAWQRLEIDLALLPSILAARDTGSAEPARNFAVEALTRAAKRLRVKGGDLAALPVDTRHELRKSAKRLRYACEFFAPAFPAKPAKKYLARLADLQEALGALNDGSVAAAITAHLGGGAFAQGAVAGFVAASAAGAADDARDAWRRFRKQPRFWQ